MIKIISEQPQYHYDHTGYQDYDLKTEMVLREDISAIDAIIAFMRMLNIATYRVNIETLKETINKLQDEGYEDKERVL